MDGQFRANNALKTYILSHLLGASVKKCRLIYENKYSWSCPVFSTHENEYPQKLVQLKVYQLFGGCKGFPNCRVDIQKI